MLRTVLGARRGLLLTPSPLSPYSASSGGSGWARTASLRTFWWSGDSGDQKGGGSGAGGAGGNNKGAGAGAGNAAAKDDDPDDSGAEIVETPSDIARSGQGENAPKPPIVIALPVVRRPLFPGFMMPLNITNEPMIEALTQLKRSQQPYVGVFLTRNESEGNDLDSTLPLTDINGLYRVGTLANIAHSVPFPGGLQVMLMAHRRISITDVVPDSSPLSVKIAHHAAPKVGRRSEMVKAYSNEILATLREVVKINPMFKEHIQYFSQRLDVQDAARLADFAAALTSGDRALLQSVLEADNIMDRVKGALSLVKHELELSRLQQDISKQVDERMTKQQRNYMLQEQLKSIKKELGLEKEDKEALLQKFRDRIKDLQIPKEAKTVIDDEMEKLSSLEKNSSEFNVTRAYLDWLTSLPWGKFSEENFDLERAKKVLDEDHYGMQDVKDRVLEFIAVGNLKGSVQGKILCLVGPPGVGKTSIGKSIARSLNREFFRFSVGGLTDVAEIKGHRRTYVGAMPGKLIQCLKTTQVSNPVILIDEIDKLGRGYQGDPASALLEMLDPNQNGSFMDHYLDVPVDASKVLFLVTANVTDTIPAPLLDRMEVIQLSGYDSTEKIEIARKYLEPKARTECGLLPTHAHTPPTLGLADNAIDALIRWYCRESGVRNLEQHITRIYQKAALKVVRATADERATKDWLIQDKDLIDYVGKRRFISDRMYDNTPAGVVTGLAWTSMGGSVLYIEVTAPNMANGTSSSSSKDDEHKDHGGGHSLRLTGKLGDVMKESAQISMTVAQHELRKLDPTNRFFDRAAVHMHVPEGATPKDGPSAGCTMVTAVLSLAMNQPVRPNLAMTGEISLTGMVLPVGGIKEKTMAARRGGVTTLVFPEGNRRDWDELPKYIQEGLEVHFAKTYDDVYAVAFGPKPTQTA